MRYDRKTDFGLAATDSPGESGLERLAEETAETDLERRQLAELLEQAYQLAEVAGLLYTQKYLKIAALAVEIEAGEPYYLREADDVADRPRESG